MTQRDTVIASVPQCHCVGAERRKQSPPRVTRIASSYNGSTDGTPI